jgi:hypothetical protein
MSSSTAFPPEFISLLSPPERGVIPLLQTAGVDDHPPPNVQESRLLAVGIASFRGSGIRVEDTVFPVEIV